MIKGFAENRIMQDDAHREWGFVFQFLSRSVYLKSNANGNCVLNALFLGWKNMSSWNPSYQLEERCWMLDFGWVRVWVGHTRAANI